MNHKLLAALTVAVAGVPGVASAATIGMEPDGVHYRAASGEVNAIERPPDLAGPSRFFEYAAPLQVGDGCTDGNPVLCPLANTTADLGNKDDIASINVFGPSTTINGGSGDDEILAGGFSASATGGSGDDIIKLFADGDVSASGGSGDDRITESAGGGTLDGDSGADLLRGGANGVTTVLDGGDGADQLVGTSALSSLTLRGGNGLDVLVGPADGRHATLDGGNGLDRIQSRAGGATIDAGSGSDLVDAAHGGSADTIVCGSGFDVVFADPEDTVGDDCEWRFDTAAPAHLGFEDAIAAADELAAYKIDPSRLG